METPRIYADFQNLDENNRIRLTSEGTRTDIARIGLELKEGLRAAFCMDDADDSGRPDPLVVDGVVTFNAVERCWVATVDWDSATHASDRNPGPAIADGASDVTSPFSARSA